MKKQVSIALVLLFFLGSVGIPLFRHTCSMEDITIHTLFTSSGHCEEMTAPPVLEKSCCKTGKKHNTVRKTKTHARQSSCCKDDVKRLAMQFGFFEHWQLTAIVPNEISIAAFLPYASVLPREEQLRFAANSDPPVLSGRDRLHSICILRL